MTEEQFQAAVKLPLEDQVQAMVRDNCPDSPPPMGAKRERALKVLWKLEQLAPREDIIRKLRIMCTRGAAGEEHGKTNHVLNVEYHGVGSEG